MVQSFYVQTLYADLDGPVAYSDHGGSGTPVVLIHGLGGSRFNWMEVVAPLAARHRVYSLDLIGFGDTPPAGRVANLRNHRLVIDRFLEHVVGEPAILIGNSMGGLLSMYEAAAAPEKVSRLVLVDPATPNPRFEGADALVLGFFFFLLTPGVHRVLRARTRRLGPDRIVRMTLEMVCADRRRLRPEVVAAHVALHRRRVEEMPWADRALVESARSLLALLVGGAVDYFQTASQVRVPTLLIQGERDRLVPVESVRRLVRRNPGWELRVLPDIGHVPMLESPGEFLDVVGAWLEDRAAAAAV